MQQTDRLISVRTNTHTQAGTKRAPTQPNPSKPRRKKSARHLGVPDGRVAHQRVGLNLGRLDLRHEVPDAVERGQVEVHDGVRRGVHAEVLGAGLRLGERAHRHDHVPVPGVSENLGTLQANPCRINNK